MIPSSKRAFHDRARRAAAWTISGICLSGAVLACNALLGIEEPVEKQGAIDTSSAGPGGPGGGGQGPCFSLEEPVADAVFVDSVRGVDKDDATAGSKSQPLLTIKRALALARVPRAQRIYLHEGNYRESVVLTLDNNGVIIEGGWIAEGDVWRKDCAPGAVDRTRVVGADMTTNVAVHAIDVRAPTALRDLTVQTRRAVPSPSGAGESVFGLLIEGAGSVLALTSVNLIAEPAGAGRTEVNVPPMEGTPECDGNTDCCPATDTACGGREGPPAPPDAAEGSPASEGRFTPAGFAPSAGSEGDGGRNGLNGREGSASSDRGQCVPGSCGTCLNGGCVGSNPMTPGTVTGPTGKCGCGGNGGAGGAGGPGGGASVALFIATGAQVIATNSVFQAGAGGDGAPGQAGGLGGTGRPPATPPPIRCVQFCDSPALCVDALDCEQVTSELAAGAAGTPGAPGGRGGRGGGGAGGPSIAVLITAPGAFDDKEGNTLLPGSGGKGSDGAPDGQSEARLDVQ